MRGFSLIEAVFAIAFLVLIGVAMSVLSSSALDITSRTEVKATAVSLNEEALSIIALKRRSNPNFSQEIVENNCSSSGCYLNCPTNALNAVCEFSRLDSPITVGASKAPFHRRIQIEQSSGYLVTSTTSWGTGTNKQIKASLKLD